MGELARNAWGFWENFDLISKRKKLDLNSSSIIIFLKTNKQTNKKQEAKRLCREVVEYVQVRKRDRERERKNSKRGRMDRESSL